MAEVSSQQFKKGQEFNLCSISQLKYNRPGYEFSHWILSDNELCTFENGQAVTFISDYVDLVAKWNPNDLSLKFNSNGNETTGTMDVQLFTYDIAQKLNKNQFEKQHTINYNAQGGVCEKTSETVSCEFLYWAGQSQPSTQYHKVTYHANKSTAFSSKMRFFTNAEEYVYLDEEEVTNPLDMASGEGTIYAIWRNGTVTLPLPTKAGCDFSGWSINNQIYSAGSEYTLTESVYANATWSQRSYEVCSNLTGCKNTSYMNPGEYSETNNFQLTADEGATTGYVNKITRFAIYNGDKISYCEPSSVYCSYNFNMSSEWGEFKDKVYLSNTIESMPKTHYIHPISANVGQPEIWGDYI